MFRICFLLLPSALVSWGGQTPVEPPGPRHIVTGTVVNALTGEPIRRALVDMHGIVPKSTLTGSDGRFQMEGVPAGLVMFFAQKPGFFDSRTMPGGESSSPALWSAVGDGKNDFLVKLLPGARIAGRITNHEGEPMEGAQLQILHEQILQGHKQWQTSNNANTDEDGYFCADQLPAGRYLVFMTGPQFEVTVPAYYPNASDIESAQAIDLRPGQEFRADFRLRSERTYRVSGQVFGVPLTNGVGLSIQNSSGQTVSFPLDLDPASGQFVAPAMPSGNWTLLLFAADSEGHQYQARQEIAVTHADLENVRITAHLNAVIPLTVNHSAVPAAGVEGTIFANLISVDQPNIQTNGTQQQGDPPVLSFVNVTPGKYKLDVQGFGHECLESARYGGIDLTRDYLLVSAGGATQPLIINLRADCAGITAKLRPADQQRPAVALVVPTSGIGEPKVLPIQAQPKQGMIYAWPNQAVALSPGSYQVYAFSTLDGLEYANRQVLRNYPSQNVTLGPGDKTEVTLELAEPK